MLVEDGLVTNEQYKTPLFKAADLTCILAAPWTQNDLILIPDRIRVQVTLLINLYCKNGPTKRVFL